MTKAKKQSLMLIIAIALVMFLVVSIIGMSNDIPVVKAEDSGDIAMGEEGAINIGGLMINGNVPDNYSVSGTPISSVSELQSFLKGENGTYGYLTTDITGFSWSNSLLLLMEF